MVFIYSLSLSLNVRRKTNKRTKCNHPLKFFHRTKYRRRSAELLPKKPDGHMHHWRGTKRNRIHSLHYLSHMQHSGHPSSSLNAPPLQRDGMWTYLCQCTCRYNQKSIRHNSQNWIQDSTTVSANVEDKNVYIYLKFSLKYVAMSGFAFYALLTWLKY